MKKVIFLIVVAVILVVLAIIIFDKPNVKYKPKSESNPVTETTVALDESKIKTVDSSKITKPKLEEKKLPIHPEKKKSTIPKATSFVINSDNVRLRTKPNLDSEILETIKIGTKVNMAGFITDGAKVENYKVAKWHKVRTPNEVGYVYGAFLTPHNGIFGRRFTIAETIYAVQVQKNPGTSKEVKISIPANTKILITENTKDKFLNTSDSKFHYWYKIDHGKATGWVYGANLRHVGSIQ